MILYLVRHGEAEPDHVDDRRPLSKKGREEVESVAAILVERGIKVDQVLHSGKLRAAETAAILSRAVSPYQPELEAGGLRPNDDPARWAEELLDRQGALMIIGHLPFMSLLAGILLHGDPERGAAFPTASVVCLSGEAGQWTLEWTKVP